MGASWYSVCMGERGERNNEIKSHLWGRRASFFLFCRDMGNGVSLMISVRTGSDTWCPSKTEAFSSHLLFVPAEAWLPLGRCSSCRTGCLKCLGNTPEWGGCEVPAGQPFNFFFNFWHQLEFVANNKLNIILGGYLNINFLSVASSKKEFQLLLSVNGCMNVISQPTRMTPGSATLIDLFVTYFDESSVRSGVIASGISDYLPIFIYLKHKFKKAHKQKFV